MLQKAKDKPKVKNNPTRVFGTKSRYHLVFSMLCTVVPMNRKREKEKHSFFILNCAFLDGYIEIVGGALHGEVVNVVLQDRGHLQLLYHGASTLQNTEEAYIYI